MLAFSCQKRLLIDVREKKRRQNASFFFSCVVYPNFRLHNTELRKTCNMQNLYGTRKLPRELDKRRHHRRQAKREQERTERGGGGKARQGKKACIYAQLQIQSTNDHNPKVFLGFPLAWMHACTRKQQTACYPRRLLGRLSRRSLPSPGRTTASHSNRGGPPPPAVATPPRLLLLLARPLPPPTGTTPSPRRPTWMHTLPVMSLAISIRLRTRST